MIRDNNKLERLLIDASCVVENPWGAQWDGPCTGTWHIHIPCAVVALESVTSGPVNNGITGELRNAILEMDKAASCLRYELPGSVWEDVYKRWNTVRKLMLAKMLQYD